MIQTERKSILAAACDALLAALPDAWAIYVFGRFARGEEWPGSDLDSASCCLQRAGLRASWTS